MEGERMLVGQAQNLEIIKESIANDALPRFIIISGGRGSGKKTLASYIASMLHATLVYRPLGVDSVRETIESAYFCSTPVVYVFPHADIMSKQGLNALLKVTEEPPKQAYFILTVLGTEYVLPTLISRATVLRMEPYTVPELQLFMRPNTDDLVLDIARTPGQLQELQKLGNDYLDYAQQILDNIGIVTGVNSFKIAMKMKFKEDAEGFEPELILRCVSAIAHHRMLEAPLRTAPGYLLRLHETIKCCSAYINQLRQNGVRKDSTFDMWILAMRDIWTVSEEE